MAVKNNNRNTGNSNSSNNNGGYNKQRIEAYANIEIQFEDGEVGKFPKGLPILESQMHSDFLYNLVEDAKESEEAGETLEFEIMCKVKVLINKANGDTPVERKKRTYK